MKHFILLLSTFLCAITLNACHKQRDPKKENIDGDGWITPYLFDAIVKIGDLELKPNNNNGYQLGIPDRTALLLMLSGKVYYWHGEEHKEEFKRLAEKIGDLPKKEGYEHATPVDNITTEAPISSIEIKALSSYDAEHPEGSSLKDIIRIRYTSFDHVFDPTIDTNYDPSIGVSHYQRGYSIEPEVGFNPIKHPALRGGGFSGKEGLFKKGLTMSIEFTKDPIFPRQKIQVSLSFGNGLTLKKEIDIDIIRLKN